MPNPADPGTFEVRITNRITFSTMPPKTGNTGDMERWLWDRQMFEDYVEAAAAPAGVVIFRRRIEGY